MLHIMQYNTVQSDCTVLCCMRDMLYHTVLDCIKNMNCTAGCTRSAWQAMECTVSGKLASVKGLSDACYMQPLIRAQAATVASSPHQTMHSFTMVSQATHNLITDQVVESVIPACKLFEA